MDDGSIALSTSAALRFAWEKTKDNLKPLLLIALAGAFLALLSQPASRPYGPFDPVLRLALHAAQLAVALVFCRVALRLTDGAPVQLRELKPLFAGYVGFLVTALLYEVVVFIGLVLLVVPGVLWGVRFGLAPLLVVDRKLDVFEAMRESARLTAGHRRELFLLGLALFGLNLLGAVALGLGLLLTIPLTFLAAAYALRELEGRRPAEAAPRLPATPAASH